MIYTYLCSKCSLTFDAFRHVDNRNDPINCPECGGVAVKCLTTQVTVDIPNESLKTDFGDGEKVYSRSAYKDKCKSLGRDPVGLVNLTSGRRSK
jgi:putative FmdB family regulatory protein